MIFSTGSFYLTNCIIINAMKNKLLSTIFILTFMTALGQNYKISPSKTVSVSAPYNDTSKFEIYLENISNTTITINWELVSNKLVAGWNIFICDNVSCCQGVPQKGTLPYIDPGIEVYLALNVDPKTIPGNGILKLYVYEEGNSTNGDTLTWIVNSSPTGVNELPLNPDIKIYPNPSTGLFTVTSQKNNIFTVAVLNYMGKLLKTYDNIEEKTKIDLSSFDKGIYLLKIISNANTTTEKIIIE